MRDSTVGKPAQPYPLFEACYNRPFILAEGVSIVVEVGVVLGHGGHQLVQCTYTTPHNCIVRLKGFIVSLHALGLTFSVVSLPRLPAVSCLIFLFLQILVLLAGPCCATVACLLS
jgi:hypothetical protein